MCELLAQQVFSILSHPMDCLKNMTALCVARPNSFCIDLVIAKLST